MRFQKADQRTEQVPVRQSRAQFILIHSGEVKEPSGAPFVSERRGQRLERQRLCVERRVICRVAQHRLSWNWHHWGVHLAKILVVEDNALNIKLFCDLLTAHGHQTEPVTDSREALDAARAFDPDLVITDIQLPYVTGIELMEQLRADDRLKDVPIMAVTAYAAAGDDERIRAAGAQAYVSKPISVMRFAETVDQLLENGRLVEETIPDPR